MGAGSEPGLSPLTLAWLDDHPRARGIVREVWDALDEHDLAGRDTTALRKLLLEHQPTLFRHRCSACHRRIRSLPIPFPCSVWYHARVTLGLLPSSWPPPPPRIP